MQDKRNFSRKVLGDLQARTEELAELCPGPRHMLVLPKGESLVPPVRPGVEMFSLGPSPPLPEVAFGESQVAGELPPSRFWPQQVEPWMALVYGPQSNPARVHLLFGHDLEGLLLLQRLADDIREIRPHISSTMIHSPRCSCGDEQFDNMDGWLCTIHWCAWWTDHPVRVRPQAVLAGNAYEVDWRDDSMKSSLSFSMLDTGVLHASAMTLGLLRRFIDDPPDPWGRVELELLQEKSAAAGSVSGNPEDRRPMDATALPEAGAAETTVQVGKPSNSAIQHVPQCAGGPSREERRGRKTETNPKEDARIVVAWESGCYETLAELERELDLAAGEARKAIDRHRKRRKN